MKRLSQVVFLLFAVSCSQPTDAELEFITVTPISRLEVPYEAKSAAISKLNSGFASFQINSTAIHVWTPELVLSYKLGGEGRGPGEIGKIAAVVSSNYGTLVLDTMNRSILKYDVNGEFDQSIYYEDMIQSLAVDSTDTIYSLVVNSERITVKKSRFTNFSESSILFSMPIRDLSEAAIKLNVHGGHLFLNLFLTNKTLILDLNTLELNTLTNHFLPSEAEFSPNGPYKLPIRPVWRTNALIENMIFQLRNVSDSKSEVYRSDWNGTIDAIFTFNHYTTNFFAVEDEIWMFSPDSLYKYPKSRFLW
jgi:hypothetical protein